MMQRFLASRWFVVLLFAIGMAVRVAGIDQVPPGLNQDEASIGYDAYALLHYGIDRNGFHNPVHLVSWGSGQNALYAYLAMPLIWLFGLTPLSLRGVSILFGLLGLLFFYGAAKKIVDRRFALVTLFMLVISPWHIMMSRWALESNIFPTVFLMAVYFLLHSAEKKLYLPISMLLFGAALYAYGTSYFFVPVFLFFITVYSLKTKWLKSSIEAAFGLALFAAVSIPIFLFVMINKFKLESLDTGLFVVPRLTGTPRFDDISTLFSGQLLEQSLRNLTAFVNLLLNQSDGLLWNAIPGYGLFYMFGLPFLLLGFGYALRDLFKAEMNKTAVFVIVAWFFSAVLLSFVIKVNINRMNILLYPAIFFIANGIWQLKRWKTWTVYVTIAAFAVQFMLFSHEYFTKYPAQLSGLFYESFGEAIQYASKVAPGDIYITDKVNMPYIYVLFYERTDPNEFIRTARYLNPDAPFQMVQSFSRYHFGVSEVSDKENRTYVVPLTESYRFDPNLFAIQSFKHYLVAVKRP
ncbi:glycosyltransferase family 39 protein [Paenibacillus sp. GCM10027628]|uniref:glycosyltransferase family 39 protein n=1 Tax=Paenibacillus sp. GCM10027628 TaxID=3273413 RepID=UPI0036359978